MHYMYGAVEPMSHAFNAMQNLWLNLSAARDKRPDYIRIPKQKNHFMTIDQKRDTISITGRYQ
jgi:hypothetical protein